MTGKATLKATIKTLTDELKADSVELQGDASMIEQLKKTILDLNGQIPVHDPLETFWNTKRPATNTYTYPARADPANTGVNIQMDVRFFFENQDSMLPLQVSTSHDDIALKSLQWVINNIQYVSDISQYKAQEEWAFCAETLYNRKGDCEDGAILLANMMVKAGIPKFRVRLNAGDVWDGSGNIINKSKVGHCWVTYLKEADNQWYVLDWCYFQGVTLWKTAEKYFDIWFSFSADNIYAADMLDKP